MQKISRIKIFGAILIALVLSGCAAARLVPASGEQQAAGVQTVSKTERGVKITVTPSAWKGEPRNLTLYATPVFMRIENETESDVTIRREDIVLFDEARTQYSAIPPETIAKILDASSRRLYAFHTFSAFRFGYGFGFSRFRRFGFSPFFYNDFFYDPFWRFPYYADYPSQSSPDVITRALGEETIKPKAAAEGFIYLKKIPPKTGNLTLEVEYKIEGEENAAKLSFPLAVELKRY